MRVSYSLSNGNLVWTDTDLGGSPAHGSTFCPQDWLSTQGTVLTTLPDSAGTDVPVAFNHDRGNALTGDPARLGLPTVTVIAGGSLSTAAGNFVSLGADVVTQRRPRVHDSHSRPQQFGATSTRPPYNMAPASPWGIPGACGLVFLTVPSQNESSQTATGPSQSDIPPRRSSMHTALIRSRSPAPAARDPRGWDRPDDRNFDEGFDPTILASSRPASSIRRSAFPTRRASSRSTTQGRPNANNGVSPRPRSMSNGPTPLLRRLTSFCSIFTGRSYCNRPRGHLLHQSVG